MIPSFFFLQHSTLFIEITLRAYQWLRLFCVRKLMLWWMLNKTILITLIARQHPKRLMRLFCLFLHLTSYKSNAVKIHENLWSRIAFIPPPELYKKDVLPFTVIFMMHVTSWLLIKKYALLWQTINIELAYIFLKVFIAVADRVYVTRTERTDSSRRVLVITFVGRPSYIFWGGDSAPKLRYLASDVYVLHLVLAMAMATPRFSCPW